MKRLARWLRRLLVVVLLIAVAAFFGIPALVSGSWGRDRIANLIADGLGVEVSLGEVDFGWFSGFVVDDAEIGTGDDALRVRRLAVHPELLSLLGDDIRLKRVEVEGIELTVVRGAEGDWTMPGTPKPTRKPKERAKEPKEHKSIAAAFAVRDARITIRDAASGAESTVEGASVEGVLDADGRIRDLMISATSPSLLVEGEAELLAGLALRKDPSFVGHVRVDDLALGEARAWLPEDAPALAGLVSAEADVEVRGRAIRAARLAVNAGGATIRGENLAREKNGNLSGTVRIEGDPDAVRTLAPGLVPDGVAGNIVAEATIAGRLSRPKGSFSIRASGVAAPGTPPALAHRPIQIAGTARWDGALSIENATVRRGSSSLELEARLETDGPRVEATLRGSVEATEIVELLPVDRSPVRAGLVDVDAHATITRDGSAWQATIERFTATRPGLVARVAGRAVSAGPVAEGKFEIEATAAALRETLAKATSVPGDVTARYDVKLSGSDWTAEGEATLARSDGSPILPDLPEAGARWQVAGPVRGTTDLSAIHAADLSLRLGDKRMTVVEADLTEPLEPGRRGRLVARWDGRLSANRPSRPVDFQARSEGRVEVEVRGRRVTVIADTRFRDLVLTLPDRPEIREADLRVETELRVRASTPVRIGVRSLLVETPDVHVEGDGSLSNVLGEPRGHFVGTFRADVERLRPWLPERRGLRPTGVVTGRLEVDASGDEIGVKGTVASTRLAAREDAVLEDLQLDLDVFVPRNVLVSRRVRARKAELRAKDVSASVAGALDLSGRRPEFLGRAEAKANLASFSEILERLGRAAEGTVRVEMKARERGLATIALSVSGLRVAIPELSPEPIVEETVDGTATVVWPAGSRRPRVRDPHVETAWGILDAKGEVDLTGPLDVKMTADVDLPGLLAAHRSRFPTGTKARGRGKGTLAVAGDRRKLKRLTAEGSFTLERITMPGYDVKDGRFAVKMADAVLEVTEAKAMLNGGPASFVGEVDARSGPPLVSGEFETSDVRLVRRMEPQARFVSPIFALATEMSGRLGAKGSFEARGRTPADLKRTLLGEVDVTIADGRVAGSPFVGALLSLLSRGSGGSSIDLDDLKTSIKVAEGRLATEDLRLTAGDVELRFRGMTGLTDQKIDYVLRVKLPGDDDRISPWLRVLDPDGYIPLRLGGTLSSPRLKPPDMADVGRNLLEDILKRAFEKAGERKKKKPKKDRR